MKYFFLSEGWTVARVWGSEGLWNATAWRRQPEIKRVNLCLIEPEEPEETLWLYRVEDAVLMVEVKPLHPDASATASIGQVVLKRLMSADEAIDRLCTYVSKCQPTSGANDALQG